MSNFKVGDLCRISAGTPVWCITLQEAVTFSKDIYCEVTNTTFDNESYFLKKKEILFNFPGGIPGAIDGIGEFHVSKKAMNSYTLPPPQLLTIRYDK